MPFRATAADVTSNCRTLVAESAETAFCAYTSAAALVGVTRSSVTRGNGPHTTATLRDTSADPELVDEQAPVRVVLVVADPGREEGQVSRVVQGNPRCLGGEFAVDGRPACCGRGGIARLGCQRALGLGVDLRVAE